MKKTNILKISVGFLLMMNTVQGQTFWPEDFITEKASNKFTEVGTSRDGLNSPVDLDFNKKDSTELWVINMRSESIGGSTVTYRNVGKSNQEAFHKVDGNSRHFMSLPTALAFGDKGDWANSPGVLDANFSNGQRAPFTGPSLWSSDFSIYAQYAGPGTNGSHLDMLHGSPYSAGIAWYKNNEYFVFDGYNGHVAMYDFAADHGPGNSWHDDGRLRRYPEISLKRLGLIPGHMEVDPQRKWLYVNDIGNKRIVRIDITSGSVKGTSTVRASETLAENVDMENVAWEVVANTGLERPCGLDVTNDRLIISDNGTSEIIVYDLTQSNGFPEMGRIKLTGFNDVMGLKLDYDGKIWFVDKSSKQVVRIDNENVNRREPDGTFVGLEESNTVSFKVFPNPSTDYVTVSGFDKESVMVKVSDLSGRTVIHKKIGLNNALVNIKELNRGIYVLTLSDETDSVIGSQRLYKH